MAIVIIREGREGEEDRVLTEAVEIAAFLAPFGIWYRRFEGIEALPAAAGKREILQAYDEPIRRLKAEGGYVTADVIDIEPDLPGLEAMLNRFNKEHWHDEDEVRFIIEGRGIFHIHPDAGPVFSIEMLRGDMIKVPRGTHHWFDLCAERKIRAVRLFQDPSGWTPHYTGSGQEKLHQPLCFGLSYLPVAEG